MRWEYIFVDCYLGPDTWRPRFANREPLPEWEAGTPVHDYCNRLGQDGWELVSSEKSIYHTTAEGKIRRGKRVRVRLKSEQVWRLAFKRKVDERV